MCRAGGRRRQRPDSSHETLQPCLPAWTCARGLHTHHPAAPPRPPPPKKKERAKAAGPTSAVPGGTHPDPGGRLARQHPAHQRRRRSRCPGRSGPAPAPRAPSSACSRHPRSRGSPPLKTGRSAAEGNKRAACHSRGHASEALAASASTDARKQAAAALRALPLASAAPRTAPPFLCPP